MTGTINSCTSEENHPTLTTEQEKELIKRDVAFARGETSARNWDDIIRDLEKIYR